jgi:anti-anti-sigma regulatory factor
VLVLPAWTGAAVGRGLCRRLEQALAAGGVEGVVCDASAVRRPDLAVVDTVARLALIAHRRGQELRLVHAGAALCELLALTGLDVPVMPRDRQRPRP